MQKIMKTKQGEVLHQGLQKQRQETNIYFMKNLGGDIL